MKKRVLNIISWLALVIGIGFLLGFTKQKQKEKVCKSLEIQIDHSNGNTFINEDDIFQMVYHEVDTMVGKPLNAINSAHLERKIGNHPAVQNSEVYKTIDGKVVIEVSQRTPIVRIFSFNGDSYYIDSNAKVMPPSSKYTANLMIASGFVFEDYIAASQIDIKNEIKNKKGTTIITDIFKMAEYINNDPLWSAQIEQLYVNKDFEIELIPRIGNHRIVFGDAVSIKGKFDKLKIFYKEGLDKSGWNEYSVINLKYANQVVCTKR